VSYYAIVQHSSTSAEFARAVETTSVRTWAVIKAVLDAGGVVFGSYASAEAFAENENYPAGTEGLIPQARGCFSERVALDGLAVYRPEIGVER
jgi:hypothetical protein